jgi:hypothetical protein
MKVPLAKFFGTVVFWVLWSGWMVHAPEYCIEPSALDSSSIVQCDLRYLSGVWCY